MGEEVINTGARSVSKLTVAITSHGPGEPMEFVTPFALTLPGAMAAFKVHVVLTSGNEGGSAEMVVERPLALAA